MTSITGTMTYRKQHRRHMGMNEIPLSMLSKLWPITVDFCVVLLLTETDTGSLHSFEMCTETMCESVQTFLWKSTKTNQCWVEDRCDRIWMEIIIVTGRLEFLLKKLTWNQMLRSRNSNLRLSKRLHNLSQQKWVSKPKTPESFYSCSVCHHHIYLKLASLAQSRRMDRNFAVFPMIKIGNLVWCFFAIKSRKIQQVENYSTP